MAGIKTAQLQIQISMNEPISGENTVYACFIGGLYSTYQDSSYRQEQISMNGPISGENTVSACFIGGLKTGMSFEEKQMASPFKTTVEPLYQGHPWDVSLIEMCPDYRGQTNRNEQFGTELWCPQ
jgi:hypothetical protein